MKRLGEGADKIGFLAKGEDDEEVCVAVFKEGTDKGFEVEYGIAQKGLNHPNVLEMLGAGSGPLTLDDDDQGERKYIVSEFAENGELY
jgi:hypothetical protein